MAADAVPPLFSASEMNLLVYHYLKESGFHHACFALRYEARLDDLPVAHEPVVQPGQLLRYVQKGLLYATAERHVREHGEDAQRAPEPDPLIAAAEHGVDADATKGRAISPPLAPQTPAPTSRRKDAASQTPAVDADAGADTASAKRASTSVEPVREKRSKQESPQSRDVHGADAADHKPKKGSSSNASSGAPDSGSSGNGPSPSTSAAPSMPPRSHGASGAPAGAVESLPDDALTVLSGHTAEVFVAAWNPTVPDLLASGAGDATVRIWDLNAANDAPVVCKHLPQTHAKNISTLEWNQDGTLLASGSYDGILRLWTPQGDLHLVMSMHQGPIFGVRWNSRGNLLLTGSTDGSAIVWDVGSGRTRQQFNVHSDNVLDVQWLTAVPPRAPGTPAYAGPQHTDPAAADTVFATCSADNSVQICRLGEPKPIQSFLSHADEVNAIRFDPSQTRLASVSDDCTAMIWAVRAPGVASDDAAGVDGDDLLFTLTGHTKELYALAWSPTGPGSPYPDRPRMLATTSFDETTRLWNGDTGECLRVFTGHEHSVYAVCFSPCARFIATGGIDSKVLVHNIEVRLHTLCLAHVLTIAGRISRSQLHWRRCGAGPCLAHAGCQGA